ncbi:glycosyltransferase family 4 protein [Nocardioides sp. C4-1]|uniref:glycosyltransferase family 4 protein n=1 Tax=Nocardioides sp. C4-1 TaxID=3151851 RepID=UPI003266E37E
MPALEDVGELAGVVVFVSEAPFVATRRPAYQMLHVPPPLRRQRQTEVAASMRDRIPIATSRYAADLWARFLDVDVATVHVVYPFAEAAFAQVARTTSPRGVARVLYAGRLSPEKGIYTFLSMLHTDIVEDDPSLFFTVTTAGADKPQGHIIEGMVRAHPRVDLVSARVSPEEMAVLVAGHDVVVMPSNGQYWHETFGIVSIEAQHSGARVVASDDGGLPETQCGALHLVAPDDAEALARGILDALSCAPPTPTQRAAAATCFTIEQSVDALLGVFEEPEPVTPLRMVRELEALISLPDAPASVRRPATTTRPVEEVPS